MEAICERYKKLFKQMIPEEMYGVKDLFTMLYHYIVRDAVKRGLCLSSTEPIYECKNIDYLERSYEAGYAAIINDGKLLGFVEEKNPV